MVDSVLVSNFLPIFLNYDAFFFIIIVKTDDKKSSLSICIWNTEYLIYQGFRKGIGIYFDFSKFSCYKSSTAI